MQKCIVGRKLGMTQLFDENGKFIPVTVVEAGPCVVVQKKTIENDGYEAVQIGFGALSDKRATKAIKGHFAKADVALKKTLKEFRLDDIAALNVGDIIKADTFAFPGIMFVMLMFLSLFGTHGKLQCPLPEGYPRYRPRSSSCRFQRRLLRPQPCNEGQEAARPPGC